MASEREEGGETMQGLIYKEHETWNRWGDELYTIRHICIDKKLHIAQEFCEGYSLKILGPCDGSCVRMIDVDADVKAAAEDCIATGDFTARVVLTRSYEIEDEPVCEYDDPSENDEVVEQMSGGASKGGTVTLGELIDFKHCERSAGNRRPSR
jgi:hypothetical protein